MKKTQVKDATRNVKKNLLSWISVVFIAAMAASAFLGISYSAASMRNAGDSFYQRTSYRDFEVTSSLLLTNGDIDALMADEDVKDVEGIYFANAKVNNNDVHENINIVSVSERINVPEIVEGSLPKKADECAVEQTIAEKLGYKIGDTVTACDEKGNTPKFLKGKEYKITGIVLHPDHLAKPDFAPGNRYILVAPGAFDDKELDGCFMRAEIVLKSTEGLNRFSDEYKKKTDVAKERLNVIADERSALRTKEVRDKYQKEINDGQKKLDDAKEKLDKGKKELDKGKTAIKENEEKLKNAKKELDNGKQTLDSSKDKLDSAQYTLSSSKDELDAAKSELDANKQKLDNAESELNSSKELLDIAKQVLDAAKNASPEELAELTPEELQAYEQGVAYAEEKYNQGLAEYNEGKKQFDAGKAKYDSALAQYESSKAKYDSGVAQYENGKAQYDAGEAEYYSGLAQYEAGLDEYYSGKSQYDDGVAKYAENKQKYEDGVKELEKAKKTLADKEKEYNNGVKEYKKNVQKLDDAKKKLADLKDCSWFVFDIGSNGGFMHLSLSAKSISSLSITFSLFFVVIAALVIYTTIKRIVDEQRKLVGTTKALGFFNSEILGKYLIFGISATIVGALIGIIAGYFVIQGVVLNSYSNMYVIGGIPAGILIGTSVLAVGLAIVLAIVAVTISCLSLMRSTAIDLMREKQPKTRKSSKKSKSGGLYSRLILRNMRSDLPRVIVTTVSVAGCCALLAIGFTLRGSVSSVADKQYGDIVKYDERLTFNSGASDNVEKDIETILDDAGIKWVKAQSGLRAFKAGSDVEYTDLVCGDMKALSEFYNFKTWKTNDNIPTDEDGVFIQCRTTETSGKDKGDEIIIYDGTMTPYNVKVAGVFNNYMARNTIMNEASYEKYFGEKPEMNTYFLCLNGADKDKLVEKLDQVKGYESLTPAAEDRGKLELVTNVFNKVAILLLVIAGLMAYFILLNITKMYVNQKTRELTIMRINGFTVKEVKRYLNTETIITTIIGILLGIGVGALMGYIVIRFIEMPHAQFVRTPYILGWVISAAITAVFSIVINAFGTRKVKDLKLTDV